MSTKRRISTRVQLIGIGALLVAISIPLAIGMQGQQEALAKHAAEAAAYKPAPVTLPTQQALKVGSFKAAAAKLREAKSPFTLTVIGDSTGFPKQGWVEVIAQEISGRSNRAVSVRTWNMNTSSYDAEHRYGEGEPLLTIWNGSAPGRDAAYSYAHLTEMVKGRSDLVIINHGHNVPDIQYLRHLTYRLAEVSGGAAMAITKQNPRTDVGAKEQAEKMAAVAPMVSELPGVVLLDAWAAYPADPTPWLSKDGVHPSPEGYQAWANVVLARLGF